MADFVVYEGTLLDSMTTEAFEGDNDQFIEYKAILSSQPFSWEITFTPNIDNVYYFRVLRTVPFIFDIDEFLVIEYVDESGKAQIKENQLIRESPYNDIKFAELQDSNRRPIVSIKIGGVRKYTWSQFGIEHEYQKTSFTDIVFVDESNDRNMHSCTKYTKHWLPKFSIPGKHEKCSATRTSNIMTLIGPSLEKLEFKTLMKFWKLSQNGLAALAFLCADGILEQFIDKPKELLDEDTDILEVMELADQLEHEELMIACLSVIADDPEEYHDQLQSVTWNISKNANCNLVLALCKNKSFDLRYKKTEYSLPEYDEDDPDVKTLVVGDRKFRVQPYYLACWSRFFDIMFFGEFVEKDKKEIPLEDILPEEFELLLELVFTKRKRLITEETVEFLLKLADRFDMPTVTGMCGEYLCKPENAASLTLLDRLSIADRNRHIDLMVNCLQKINIMEPQEKQTLAKDVRSLQPPLSISTYGNLLVALTD